MGMRGTGAISQALLGSTTMAIIAQSKVPVMAVPAKREFNGLNTVVAAMDLTQLPDLHTLDPLKTIASTFNSHLHVLHLYKKDTEQAERNKATGSLDALDACMQEINHDIHFKQTEDIPKGIHDYVEALQADLLALLPSQHTFLSRLLNKSITG
ncbi:hypothetical protein DXT99_15485 [Pontibacter diazotrophicus]|uniref:UspA domain-containing protein n=1 Tax=Pontibacter diazotrophicus TaxID=1400979 RepID=A0A3D8LA22_9BACT|nr:universal stress protein [Pontibacter diazotrophicus]RDV14193.1 hypothetical protein DXT99_15485 [Pontibacter diazotrophicus]